MVKFPEPAPHEDEATRKQQRELEELEAAGGPVHPSAETALGFTLTRRYGLTLRDYFAAEALRVICPVQVRDWKAFLDPAIWHGQPIADTAAAFFGAARFAYMLADRMLEARKEENRV